MSTWYWLRGSSSPSSVYHLTFLTEAAGFSQDTRPRSCYTLSKAGHSTTFRGGGGGGFAKGRDVDIVDPLDLHLEWIGHWSDR